MAQLDGESVRLDLGHDLDAAGDQEQARRGKKAGDHRIGHEAHPLTELERAEAEQQDAGKECAYRDGDQHVDDDRLVACALWPQARPRLEPASTLITATAGVSGRHRPATSVEVSATTMPVTTVPMISAARPSEKPADNRALEDQGAEGDAVGDLHDRRDDARQGVSPKIRQVRVARAL